MSKERSGEKKERRNSLVRGLRVITFFMIVIMAVSFFFAARYLIREERIKNSKVEAERTLNSLADGISAEIGRYRELSRLIMMDKELVRYLTADKEELDGGLRKNTRYSILNILNVTTMVDSVFAFRDDGLYINSSHDIYTVDEKRRAEKEWLAEILERRGASVISVNGNGAIHRNNGLPIVSIGRVINDISSQEKIGIMFMNISTVFLDRKLDVLGGGDLIVMSEDGLVLSGDESLKQYLPPGDYSETIMHEMITDGASEVMFSYCRVPDTPLIIACATRVGSGFVMFETIRVIIILILIFLGLILVESAFITRFITSPVQVLTRAMEHNRETGRLETIDVSMGNNEFGILKDSYNAMVQRVNELFARNIDNEKQIRRAELRVLQEQIKPHFLYNSLETISFLALDAGAENVHDALETLGSFYRNFLSKGNRTITLEQEVRIVRDYLSLQKLRYGDVIEDVYEIEDGAGESIIPKLILQPLVENSIYHGIRLKGEKGVIRISAFRKEEGLHLLVYDTGVGMSEEQIRHFLSPEKPEYHHGPESSFGLRGTIERIRIWCGRDDVVKIRSEVGEYTEVEFIIYERQEEDGQEDPGNDHR